MQGAFAEHVRALEASGARTRLVRTAADLEGLDGLVIPGGESTTMTMLMERVGLLDPLRRAIERGLPVLATCAGMIVLAREITDADLDDKTLAVKSYVLRNASGAWRRLGRIHPDEVVTASPELMLIRERRK